MEPKRTPAREIGEGYSYVGLGCSFAGGVVLFVAAGYGLDRWLGLTPLFTVLGTLVGATLSFLWVWVKLKAEESERRRERQ